MTDLKSKTALVPGSTSGIGRATAIALATRYAHVLIVGRDEPRQLIEIRGIAMDARFSLLEGLPRSTEGERESA
jgi:NAD(P)-dependent dehydrogenase (short-subunit alcohol dehydrogenase family)